ncbi:MAG: hypothetical protein IT371_04335 [Deltaproteobacteria bacterium]|nr:hypothetical protein [Deltaproteobacteria bacterium]
MARVAHVGLFHREIVERLSPAGLDLLVATGIRLSEGEISPDGRYYGSTMVTLDLGKLAGRVRDACDVSTAVRLALLLAADAAALERFAALGRAEAQRIAGGALQALQSEVRVRAERACVFVDVDLEGQADQAAHAHR